MRDLLIAAGALTAWSIAHSVLASLTVKSWVRERVGRWFLLYRVAYVAFAGITVYALWLWLPRPAGVLYIVPPPWAHIMRLVQALAIGGFLLTARQINSREFLGFAQIGRIHTAGETAVIHDEEPERSTRGLYGVVRHPLYTTAVVAMAATPNMTVWWLLLTVWVTLYFVIGSVFEERRMVALFGDEYREYQRTVPRFIPLPGFLRTSR